LEDSWGVFLIDSIQEGVAGTDLNGNPDISAAGLDLTYERGSNSRSLVGMFWGVEDVVASMFSIPTVGIGQRTLSENFQFVIWEQDAGYTSATFDPTRGTSDRTGLSSYVGVGDGGNPVLWMTGDGVNGFEGPGQATHDFATTLFLSGDLAGNASVYLEVDGGTTDPLLMDPPVYNAPNNDNLADLFLLMATDGLNVTNDPNFSDPQGNWTATSNDDTVGITPIPEPMTMLALGLAVGGLGGYIRKRRKA
ncbi:MAG TPA: PEP-CTERM sorting domain-containing protein, partial [Phycisphaerae bacterium]|nr:PEP-CTERM sorting domain-containing protein [Phycisphaerae bacterium]